MAVSSFPVETCSKSLALSRKYPLRQVPTSSSTHFVKYAVCDQTRDSRWTSSKVCVSPRVKTGLRSSILLLTQDLGNREFEPTPRGSASLDERPATLKRVRCRVGGVSVCTSRFWKFELDEPKSPRAGVPRPGLRPRPGRHFGVFVDYRM